MNRDEQNRMNEICQQIQIEQDHTKLGNLVRDLNDLLDGGQHGSGIPASPKCGTGTSGEFMESERF